MAGPLSPWSLGEGGEGNCAAGLSDLVALLSVAITRFCRPPSLDRTLLEVASAP